MSCLTSPTPPPTSILRSLARALTLNALSSITNGQPLSLHSLTKIGGFHSFEGRSLSSIDFHKSRLCWARASLPPSPLLDSRLSSTLASLGLALLFHRRLSWTRASLPPPPLLDPRFSSTLFQLSECSSYKFTRLMDIFGTLSSSRHAAGSLVGPPLSWSAPSKMYRGPHLSVAYLKCPQASFDFRNTTSTSLNSTLI